MKLIKKIKSQFQDLLWTRVSMKKLKENQAYRQKKRKQKQASQKKKKKNTKSQIKRREKNDIFKGMTKITDKTDSVFIKNTLQNWRQNTNKDWEKLSPKTSMNKYWRESLS